MATIKDVAQRAGVAVETVSRVLNNRGYISDKTRQKVYQAMDELNYRPNEFARGLSKKQMDMIAVIVPHIVHPYFAKVISRLEKETAARGYKLLLYNSSGDNAKIDHVLDLCNNNRVTGVILFSNDIPASVLAKYAVPIITVERFMDKGSGSVLCDNAEGGRLAARHLISKGCHNLILLGSEDDVSMPAGQRERGFLEVCGTAGCDCRVYKSGLQQYLNLEYREFIRSAIRENPAVDGIFASSDLIAAQVIQVCRDEGRRIPDDIKLVGFDDVDLAMLTSPTITTIHQPVREMVTAALELIDKADTHSVSEGPAEIILPVRLVERESTAARDSRRRVS